LDIVGLLLAGGILLLWVCCKMWREIGPPSSLVQLLTAVWTGVTRDTMPTTDMRPLCSITWSAPQQKCSPPPLALKIKLKIKSTPIVRIAVTRQWHQGEECRKETTAHDRAQT
jgi:hypothetical protein